MGNVGLYKIEVFDIEIFFLECDYKDFKNLLEVVVDFSLILNLLL